MARMSGREGGECCSGANILIQKQKISGQTTQLLLLLVLSPSTASMRPGDAANGDCDLEEFVWLAQAASGLPLMHDHMHEEFGFLPLSAQ